MTPLQTLKGPRGPAFTWPRAQRVWAICAEEGRVPHLSIANPVLLVAPADSIPPAFLCFDEWGEETAPSCMVKRRASWDDGQPIWCHAKRGRKQRAAPHGETSPRPAGIRFASDRPTAFADDRALNARRWHSLRPSPRWKPDRVARTGLTLPTEGEADKKRFAPLALAC